jgi:hypothetical protein
LGFVFAALAAGARASVRASEYFPARMNSPALLLCAIGLSADAGARHEMPAAGQARWQASTSGLM